LGNLRTYALNTEKAHVTYIDEAQNLDSKLPLLHLGFMVKRGINGTFDKKSSYLEFCKAELRNSTTHTVSVVSRVSENFLKTIRSIVKVCWVYLGKSKLDTNYVM